jgi:hypothetical protein
VLNAKINLKNKRNIILIYFKVKDILKNKYYHNVHTKSNKTPLCPKIHGIAIQSLTQSFSKNFQNTKKSKKKIRSNKKLIMKMKMKKHTSKSKLGRISRTWRN